MNAVIYIHGKGGSAAESEHYKPLFPDSEVIGLDFQTFSPWETGKEIHIAVEKLKRRYNNVILVANSIGAFFSMNADIDDIIQKGETDYQYDAVGQCYRAGTGIRRCNSH